MGQLFDRIFNFIKSEVNGGASRREYSIEDSDEELKRIIDELNNDRSAKRSSQGRNTGNVAPDGLKPELANAFAILGLSVNASVQDIKSAYRKKMLEFHPDRTVNMSENEKRNAENKSKEINRAYAILKAYRRF